MGCLPEPPLVRRARATPLCHLTCAKDSPPGTEKDSMDMLNNELSWRPVLDSSSGSASPSSISESEGRDIFGAPFVSDDL
jgi:hypothetical protein